MNTISTVVKEERITSLSNILTVLAGTGFFILCSSIKIPFYPVSFTLQSLAILILGLNLTKLQSTASILVFLLLATIGAPVMWGLPNASWYMSSLAGYYFAMPIAAYMVSSMKTRPILAMALALLTILSLGSTVLTLFISWKKAYLMGFLLFMPTEILKIFLANALCIKKSAH